MTLNKPSLTTGRGLAAYGALAERFASCFSEGDPVVVFDHVGISAALHDCATRCFNGERFYVRAVLPRESTVLADAVMPNILTSYSGIDDRRLAVDQAFAGTLQVNNQLLRDIRAFTPEAIRLMQAALRLADGLIVSSESERRRLQDVLLVDAEATTLALRDPAIPSPPETLADSNRDAIVIWAPHLAGDAASAFAVALADLRLPLLLISGSPPSDGSLATWVPPTQAADALTRAKLILDTTAHGSEAALALAAWHVPIVADIESGAVELIRGVRSYDRRRFFSIYEAVACSLGRGPATVHSESLNNVTLPGSARQRTLLREGPLVSVIIPTYNRPTLLDYALESVQRQTYRNIETIVVIDGGPTLEMLASKYPNVRFLHMAVNDSVTSCNTAFAQSNGEYIAFLNDDDLFLPDHVAELVTALERSGEAVAHGDVLTAFLRGNDEEWLLYGFESNMSRVVELTSILVSNQIGMTSCMFRHDCIQDGTPFEEAVPLYRDYALWLRLASEFTFVHVERITSCYTIRNSGTQQQSTLWYDKALRSYEVLYRQYPIQGRPLIDRRRREVLQSVTSGHMGIATARPAGDVHEVVWPLWKPGAS